LFAITLSIAAAFGAAESPESTTLAAEPGTAITEVTSITEPAPAAVPADGSAVAVPADVFELNYSPVVPADGVLPDWMARPPHRRGYCRCSCGYRCATDADCGGSSCDPFITCC